MILIRILVLFSMTWSWEVYDGGFEDGSNLRSGWRSWEEGSRVMEDWERCVVQAHLL